LLEQAGLGGGLDAALLSNSQNTDVLSTLINEKSKTRTVQTAIKKIISIPAGLSTEV